MAKANKELELRFLGCARIQLSSLNFASTREEDEKHVDRLVEEFRQECFPDDPKNFVPAVIARDLLNNILSEANLELSDLSYRAPPLLALPRDTKLECLHGRQRLLAARKLWQYLPGESQWWTVKLYESCTFLECK